MSFASGNSPEESKREQIPAVSRALQIPTDAALPSNVKRAVSINEEEGSASEEDLV